MRICGSIMSRLTIDQSLQALLTKKRCAKVGSGSFAKGNNNEQDTKI